MKLEYILIKKKDDFCNNDEQFKNLLLTNRRIFIKDNNYLEFSKTVFSYTLSSKEVKVPKNTEIVYFFNIFAFTSECSETAKKLEDFDELLRRINTKLGNHFTINIIWDDVSIYYAKKLYPLLANVENLLRKIIYSLMINVAGGSWFNKTVPNKVKNSIEETQKKNKLKTKEIRENQLYYADFIQLVNFLFLPYTLKPIDQDAIVKIRDCFNNNPKDLIAILDNYTPKSNWERYFAEKISIKDLPEKWNKLYGYRNQVAHTKRIKKAEYEDAVTIISELDSAFNSCLESIDNISMTVDETNAIQEVVNETIGPVISAIRDENNGNSLFSIPSGITIIEKYDGVISAAKVIGSASGYILPKFNIGKEIGSGLLQFSDVSKKIMNSINTNGKDSFPIQVNGTTFSNGALSNSNTSDVDNDAHKDVT